MNLSSIIDIKSREKSEDFKSKNLTNCTQTILPKFKHKKGSLSYNFNVTDNKPCLTNTNFHTIESLKLNSSLKPHKNKSLKRMISFCPSYNFNKENTNLTDNNILICKSINDSSIRFNPRHNSLILPNRQLKDHSLEQPKITKKVTKNKSKINFIIVLCDSTINDSFKVSQIEIPYLYFNNNEYYIERQKMKTDYSTTNLDTSSEKFLMTKRSQEVLIRDLSKKKLSEYSQLDFSNLKFLKKNYKIKFVHGDRSRPLITLFNNK